MQYFAKFISFLVFAILFFVLGVETSNNRKFKEVIFFFASGYNSLIELGYSFDFSENIGTWIYNQEKVHDGAILLTYNFKENPAILLIDRDGKILHSWKIEKEVINPEVRKYHDIYFSKEESIHVVPDAQILPGGDLIALHDIVQFLNLGSQRIYRMDKDSNIKWELRGFYHHEFTLDDDGKIYALSAEVKDNLANFSETPNDKILYSHDYINVISQDGEILEKYSLVDALLNSEFSGYFSNIKNDLEFANVALSEDRYIVDGLHANYVQHINKDLAASSVLFEEGDFLVSMRAISAVAIFRPRENKIVYLGKGPWKHQHHARLHEDGKIYLYDNDGANKVLLGDGEVEIKPYSRILAFEPILEKTEVIFDNHKYDMHSSWRGYYKKLPDGSYIMNSPDKSRVIQFGDGGEVFWELRGVPYREATNDLPIITKISTTHYYSKEYLKPLLQ